MLAGVQDEFADCFDARKLAVLKEERKKNNKTVPVRTTYYMSTT